MRRYSKDRTVRLWKIAGRGGRTSHFFRGGRMAFANSRIVDGRFYTFRLRLRFSGIYVANLTVYLLKSSKLENCQRHSTPPGELRSILAPWLFALSAPVYPYALAASSSLAWPLVPFSAQPGCLLTVYRSARSHAHRIFHPGLTLVHSEHRP